MKFPLKIKATILIVVISVLVSGVCIFALSNSSSQLIIDQYIARASDLSSTVAASVDVKGLEALRDEVSEIYNGIPDDERVSNEAWGEPEWEAYLSSFGKIDESENFQSLQKWLRTMQDASSAEYLYILYADEKNGSLVYLVDASYEDNCVPGSFVDTPVYRVGGDEFVLVVCPWDEAAERDRIARFKERIATLSNDTSLEPWERLSAAVGYAQFDASVDKSTADVLRRADEAMYANKKAMKAAR